MKSVTSRLYNLLTLAAATCALSVAAHAEIVYDNLDPSSYRGQWFNAGVEFGDQVNLAGTSRRLNSFRIGYYLSSSASGNETARVRFYANDGTSGGLPNGSPGTLLYDTGVLPLNGGGH